MSQDRILQSTSLRSDTLYTAKIGALGLQRELQVLEMSTDGIRVVDQYAQTFTCHPSQLGLEGSSEGSITPMRETTESEREELKRAAHFLSGKFRLETAVKLAQFLGLKQEVIRRMGIYGSLSRDAGNAHDIDAVLFVDEEKVWKNVTWTPPYRRSTFSMISRPGEMPHDFLFREVLGLKQEAIDYISTLLHGGFTVKEWQRVKKENDLRRIGRAMKLDVQLWCQPMSHELEQALRKDGRQDEFIREVCRDLKVFNFVEGKFERDENPRLFPSLHPTP